MAAVFRSLPPRSGAGPLFASATGGRALRVVVDDSAVPATATGLTMDDVLSGLLTRPSVEVLRHSDEGPPPEAERITLGTHDMVVGWMEVDREAGDPTFPARTVRWATTDSVSIAAVAGNAPEIARADAQVECYADQGADAAADHREWDAVVALAAQESGADIYITNRPYLHAMEWALTTSTVVCTPAEAIALVGLYLRSRDEFVIWSDGWFTETHAKGLFFQTGARAALPSAWGWTTACVMHDEAAGRPILTPLARSVLQRVSRALQSRDALLVALSKPLDDVTAEDALTALDNMLTGLVGAIDATATTAHLGLGLDDARLRSARWQEKNWRQSVRNALPAGSHFLPADAVLDHTDRLLRALRNTVHSVALEGVAVSRRGGRAKFEIAIPAFAHDDVHQAALGAGGLEAWGLHLLPGGHLTADPLELCDAIFSTGLRSLDRYCSAVPLEAIARAAVPAQAREAPATDDLMFGPVARASVRWQLGT